MAASPLVPNKIGGLKYPQISNVEGSITAHAGGGQTSAYQLTAQLSVVSTVASGNDSVKLPKIVPSPGVLGSVGTLLFLTNAAATNALKVYGYTPDTINAIATGTGNAISAGASVLIFAQDYTTSTGVGRWRMINTTSSAVAAITSGTIAGVTIENSTIGVSTAASGRFTNLSATSAATLNTLAVSGVVSVAGSATFANNVSVSSLVVSGAVSVVGSATFANQVTVSGLAVSAAISVGGSGTVASNFAIGGVGTVTENFFAATSAASLVGYHGVSGTAQTTAFTTISTSAGITGTVGFTASQAALILTNLNALTDLMKSLGYSA